MNCTNCNADIIDKSGTRTLCYKCEFDRTNWIRSMIIVGLCILIMGVIAARCQGGVVTVELINSIAWVESRNNPSAIGRNGERGMWQMKPCAIEDVCARYGFDARLFPTHQRAFAQAYLVLTEIRLKKELWRDPIPQELWFAWNLGFSRAIRWPDPIQSNITCKIDLIRQARRVKR